MFCAPPVLSFTDHRRWCSEDQVPTTRARPKLFSRASGTLYSHALSSAQKSGRESWTKLVLGSFKGFPNFWNYCRQSMAIVKITLAWQAWRCCNVSIQFFHLLQDLSLQEATKQQTEGGAQFTRGPIYPMILLWSLVELTFYFTELMQFIFRIWNFILLILCF